MTNNGSELKQVSFTDGGLAEVECPNGHRFTPERGSDQRCVVCDATNAIRESLEQPHTRWFMDAVAQQRQATTR